MPQGEKIVGDRALHLPQQEFAAQLDALMTTHEVVPLDDGSYIQAGIVSWGLSAGPNKTCAENAIFSAYTKVSQFLPWLEQTISQN